MEYTIVSSIRESPLYYYSTLELPWDFVDFLYFKGVFLANNSYSIHVAYSVSVKDDTEGT